MTIDREIQAYIPITLTKTFKDKIDWLVSNYPLEIGGFIVGLINENGITCEDLLIPRQEVSGAMVEIDGLAQIELRKTYGDKCLKIIGEFHSHNSMGAFWSSDDEDVIKRFSEPRDISIFIVSSKTDGHLIRVEIKKPFRLSINGLPYNSQDLEIEKEMSVLLKEFVKEKKYKYESSYKDIYSKQKGINEFADDYSSNYFNPQTIGERNFKREAGSKIKYNGKKHLKITDLSPFVADTLNIEFDNQNLNPSLTQLGDTCSIEIYFSDKSQAKKFIRDLVGHLAQLIEEEATEEQEAIEQVEKEEVEETGGLGSMSYLS